MKNIIKKLILVLVSFLVAILLLEVALRITGEYLRGPIYVQDYESGLITFKPNSSFNIKSSCFENTVRSNSVGFHSSEYPTDKPNGVYRIAVIGDSFVESNQVSLEKTFFHLLEEKLNSQTDKKYQYQVLAFGISSHGTYQNILYYKNYAQIFKPDLVIDLYSENDLEDDFIANRSQLFNISPSWSEKISKWIKTNLRRSVAIMTIRTKLKELSSNNIEKPVLANLSKSNDNQMWAKERELLKDFGKMIQENGSKFLLVSGTLGYQVHDKLMKEYLAKYGENAIINGGEGQLFAISKDNFPYLSLLSWFRQKAKENPAATTIWPCDGHWNETGHEWAADALYDFISKNNF